MFTKEEQERAEKLLLQYENLFHRVLRDCHIYLSNPEYEDYLQHLRMVFMERYAAEGDPMILGRCYQYLVWRLRDAQRKVKQRKDLQDRLDEQPKKIVFCSEMTERFWLQEIETLLDAEERQLLDRYLFSTESTKELAMIFQKTPQTIRKKLRKIREKVNRYLEGKNVS